MSLSKYDYWIKGDEMIEKSLRENMKIEMYQVPDFQYEMIIKMLQVLYVYEVAMPPSEREFDCKQIQSLIEEFEGKFKPDGLDFEVGNYHVDVTKDYEDCNFYCVVYDMTNGPPWEHEDTHRLNSMKEVDALRKSLKDLGVYDWEDETERCRCGKFLKDCDC